MTRRAITNVLVVEDNAGDARLLREMLTDGDQRIVLAHADSMGGAEAHLREHSADIILLDLGLPDVEGVGAVRRIHAAAPHVPLVVLTGLDDEELARQALQEGAQDYLIKGQIETRGLLRSMHYAIERNIMEEALFVEHQRAQVTLNCIGDAVVCADISGNITFLNLVAETMTGWSSAEAIGRTVGTVFRTTGAETAFQVAPYPAAHLDGSRCDCSNCSLLHAVRSGTGVRLGSDVFVRANGSTFAAEYTSAPMRDSKGESIGAVIAIRDISERRAIERLKEEFVSTVSHELRTPLTSIRGALGLLSSGMLGEMAEKGQRMLRIAVTNTDRLVRLINDILDIERLQSGKIEITRTSVDAHNLMAQAVESLHTIADTAGVALELEPFEAQISVDTDRIMQTLTNLVGNAIKFSPAGTRVTLSAKKENGFLTIRVADRGRGIPEGKSELIFERFKQVDASDSRDKGGSGLGLAISSSIVKAHGGRIWTEKNGEQGSVFLFTVPLLETGPALHPVATTPHTSAQTEGEIVVLVVEDDEDLCRVLSASLQAQGIRTLQASSGRMAIDTFLRHRPDLMVLDVVLPDMDGYAVVAALRQHNALKNIPLLVYSALEVTSADQQRLKLGPTAFLTKSRSSLKDVGTRIGELLEVRVLIAAC
jgi:signal transduction histidine kinase